MAEVNRDVPPPSNPFAVHVSSVRRTDRELDDYVKTYADSIKPVYAGKAPAYSYPMDLGAGLRWDTAPAATFYNNTEAGAGGWFPFGPNRVWHTGVHLFPAGNNQVHALADGEVVACRAGENDTAKTYGSRNFVLLRHKWKDKTWYSLYMHLDAGVAAAVSPIPWRQKLHLLTQKHVQATLPSPRFTSLNVGGVARLMGHHMAAPPDWEEVAGGAAPVDPTAMPILDATIPANSQVIRLANPGNTQIFVQLEGVELCKVVNANATVNAAIANHTPVGLATPIPVVAGEHLGDVGAAPTDPLLNPHGAFLHVEAFSTELLFTEPGYTVVEATDAAKMMDRKAIMNALLDKNLISPEPANVVLVTDVAPPGAGVDRGGCRSAIVKTFSAWYLDWKVVLNASPTFSFMQDAARNTAGDHMNEYRWWDDVRVDARLPVAGANLYHYHPITLMLQLASRG